MSCRTCNGAGKVKVQGERFACLDCPPSQGGAGYDVFAIIVVDELRRRCRQFPHGSHPMLDEILRLETHDLVNRVGGGSVINDRTTFRYIGTGRNQFFNLMFDSGSFTIIPD